jgi:hypothetical protein
MNYNKHIFSNKDWYSRYMSDPDSKDYDEKALEKWRRNNPPFDTKRYLYNAPSPKNREQLPQLSPDLSSKGGEGLSTNKPKILIDRKDFDNLVEIFRLGDYAYKGSFKYTIDGIPGIYHFKDGEFQSVKRQHLTVKNVGVERGMGALYKKLRKLVKEDFNKRRRS